MRSKNPSWIPSRGQPDHSAGRRPGDGQRRASRGFTLVEMLVAMTVTMILIFAVSQTFAVIGDSVARGRAAIEMSGALRTVAHRLQADLDGLTCPARPWIDSAWGQGYLEIVEGDNYDATVLRTTVVNSPNPPSTILGDIDDMLMFTARTSPNTPFVGRVQSEILGGTPGTFQTITSTVAEIVWWTGIQDRNNNGWDSDERFILYRRVLLVRPDLNLPNGYLNNPNDVLTGGAPATYASLPTFFKNNDLSVHLQTAAGTPSVRIVANSLGDLTLRANRFAHVPGTGVQGFPHLPNLYSVPNFPPPPPPPPLQFRLLDPAYQLAGARQGEDVILSDVLAFDIKVFDPRAEIRQAANGEGLDPGDPGWSLGTAIGYGAFVDLSYRFKGALTANSVFSGSPDPKAQSTRVIEYDTWAWDYERDGLKQWATNSVADQATNGFDDDGANGVDDVGERDTSPPYPVPLRGVQIKLRVYEPDTRQVRQATVVADFTPE